MSSVAIEVWEVGPHLDWLQLRHAKFMLAEEESRRAEERQHHADELLAFKRERDLERCRNDELQARLKVYCSTKCT